MEYKQLKQVVTSAIDVGFYQHLADNGFTPLQLDKLDALLDQKDVFNAIMDCMVEVNYE